MLVKELIHKIENKEIKIKEIASQYQVSDRSIQSKIKNLGYQWDSKNAKYDYIGAEPEPIDVDFHNLFDKKANTNRKIARKEVSGTTITSKEKVIPKESNSEYDVIDILLESKPKAERVYRGFYFDEDVIGIIDTVDKRKKSELVNQALRKVFKDKGLL
ncbi:hypothetical protein ACIGC1_28475 [Peribacillus butanolivorans]|uniref:hypothetical protein n=1 Tax=Peribacillus butanolivorans TaxID=421767 RepID=UPI0037C6F81F